MIHRFGGDLKRYDDYLTPLRNHIILNSDATLPIFLYSFEAGSIRNTVSNISKIPNTDGM